MRAGREIDPLEEIERNVQARAKHASIDMAAPDAIGRLHDLVRDEIATWQLDFRRGTRPFDLLEPELLGERAIRNLAGYGPLGPLLGIEMRVL